MRWGIAIVVAAAALVACHSSGGGGGGAPLGPPALQTFADYDVPVADTSPWPMMRRNRLNNGRSPVVPTSRPGRMPWRFQTGKGIFSVPVIGANGSILVGSADRFFYSLDFFGNVNWTFETGEVIDSAAAVAADGTIYVPSGDGHLYALRPDGTEIWRFAAHHSELDPEATEGTFCPPVGPIGGPSNWFEGNVVIGPGGNLYAGNDNYRFYGLTPGGVERYAFAPTLIPFGTVWSAATTRLDGSAVFGALDFFLYSIDDAGNCQWRTFMGALVTSSPAQSDDGSTIYAGSWDFNFRAVDAATGAVNWTFPSREHIYSSPAVAEDGTVYFGSVDGTLYALDGATGALLWTYDVIDPIRSSPSIAGDGTIFFSAGNGVLYAINPDGTRRWSYDATTQDRNDLNSSPALGLEYLYVGGEDGTVLAMPYEYCEQVADPRCNLDPGSDLGAQGEDLYYVTPGGRSFLDIPDPVRRGAALTFRVAIRSAGRTENAGLIASSVQIDAAPAATFDVVEQAGGQWVNLVPRDFLAAGTDYTLRFRANYEIDGAPSGAIDKTFAFRTAAETVAPPALAVGADETSAFEIRNLAPYQPPLIVSLNQIGFDSVDFLASVIDRRGDDFTLWLTAAVPGENRVDPATTTKISMDGTLDGASFILDGANLQLVTGGPPIDVRSFRIASQFDATGAFDGGTSVVAQAGCLDLGAVGLFLLLFNLCNTDGDFVSVGTIRGETFEGAPARRPAGVQFTGLTRDGTTLTAHFTADGYPLAEHSPAIVLVDDATGKAVNVNYRTALSAAADAEGDLSSVTLTGAPVTPGATRAIVVTDLFPIASVLVE